MPLRAFRCAATSQSQKAKDLTERILIASANPWSFCLAVERDFIRAHSDAYVDAANLFTLCSRASPHWRPRDKLIETMNRKIDRFVMPVINGRDVTRSILPNTEIPPLPESYDVLRSYELGNAKIGLAVLSSVTSLTTIQYPANLDEFGAVLKMAWRTAHRSLQVGNAVRALGYDKVIIFNGRHCYSRPFCDALGGGCEVIRYEQGSAGDRYIWNAGSVHHPEALRRIIEVHAFDHEAAEAFFRARLEKHSTTEVALMTANQRAGTLPPEMKPGCAVTFFTSASDEMFAVTDDPLYGAFPTQHGIALALADICAARGLQLVVRLHPHLRFKHPAWKREWNFAELKHRGALIVTPEDSADSYEMVRKAHSVVTTGSTIGLEASYLRIPNAVVGTWLAGCLGASVVTNTPEELGNFVANPHLPREGRQRALLFGSFYRAGGKRLTELDVGSHPNLARLGGRVVDPIRYAVQKLRYVRQRPCDPTALDVKSGMQAGRVLLPPGTDYTLALQKGGKAQSKMPAR